MIDRYKFKFTMLQQEILKFLFRNVGKSFNARDLARALDVSQTAIGKSLSKLKEERLIRVSKDKNSGRLSIELERENSKVILLKRAENLRAIYESEIAGYLEEKFPGSAIILFGSYSFGEDTVNSDIDIAVIGFKDKKISLEKHEKFLEKKINVNVYPSFKVIHKNLRDNILNGIVLAGRIET